MGNQSSYLSVASILNSRKMAPQQIVLMSLCCLLLMIKGLLAVSGVIKRKDMNGNMLHNSWALCNIHCLQYQERLFTFSRLTWVDKYVDLTWQICWLELTNMLTWVVKYVDLSWQICWLELTNTLTWVDKYVDLSWQIHRLELTNTLTWSKTWDVGWSGDSVSPHASAAGPNDDSEDGCQGAHRHLTIGWIIICPHSWSLSWPYAQCHADSDQLSSMTLTFLGIDLTLLAST